MRRREFKVNLSAVVVADTKEEAIRIMNNKLKYEVVSITIDSAVCVYEPPPLTEEQKVIHQLRCRAINIYHISNGVEEIHLIDGTVVKIELPRSD